MERAGRTLIDAVIDVALADGLWPSFRRVASRFTGYETDYAAECVLREWFRPSGNSRPIDGWVQIFILLFTTTAYMGLRRVRGFIGLTEVEIPAGIFLSRRLAIDLYSDRGKSVWENEIRLPNGDLVVGVIVEQPVGQRGRGRPPAPWWPTANKAAEDWLDENGEPDQVGGVTQAELEKHVIGKVAAGGFGEPGVTTIRERVPQWLDEHRKRRSIL
jgi:hypothetical protein